MPLCFKHCAMKDSEVQVPLIFIFGTNVTLRELYLCGESTGVHCND
jgi:hypothetical protein